MWPDNKVNSITDCHSVSLSKTFQVCCEQRFNRCSMLVMGMREAADQSPVTELTSGTTLTADNRRKESRLNNQQTEIYLSEFSLPVYIFV